MPCGLIRSSSAWFTRNEESAKLSRARVITAFKCRGVGAFWDAALLEQGVAVGTWRSVIEEVLP